MKEIERDCIAYAYRIGQERIKCDKLQQKIQTEFLNVELAQAFSRVKQILRPYVAQEEWAQIEGLEVIPFIEKFFVNVKQRVWVLEHKELQQCLFFIQRMLEMQGLEKEMQGRLDLEGYYSVLTKIRALESSNTKLIAAALRATQLAQECMDYLIDTYKDQEDVERLIKRVSTEVGYLVSKQMEGYEEQEPLAPLSLIEMKEAILRFKELQVRLQAPNLRQYITRKL